MGILLKQLFSLIQLLNSETGTYQISAGFSAGMVLGFAPFFSIQTLLIFLAVLIFRVQLGAVFIAAFFFKLIAFVLDPVFDSVGRFVLGQESLHGLFTYLYNLPIVPFTRFNNSVAMGALVVSLVLAPVLFFASVRLVQAYRLQVVKRFKETRFFKALSATSVYKWYHSYTQLYGES